MIYNEYLLSMISFKNCQIFDSNAAILNIIILLKALLFLSNFEQFNLQVKLG